MLVATSHLFTSRCRIPVIPLVWYPVLHFGFLSGSMCTDKCYSLCNCSSCLLNILSGPICLQAPLLQCFITFVIILTLQSKEYKNPSLLITHLPVINLSLGVNEQHVRNKEACFTLSVDNHHYPNSDHGNFSSFAGHTDTHLDYEIQENFMQFFSPRKKVHLAVQKIRYF